MRAFELKARISDGRHLEATLPENLPDGEAKIIVLLPEPEPDGDKAQRRYLRNFFRDLDSSDRPRMSKEEID